jgi:hypothetical protein
VPATIVADIFTDTVGNPAGHFSLREAITFANRNPGPDTIRLLPGTYQITRLGDDNSNDRGDFDVTGDLTIRGADSGGSTIFGDPRSSSAGRDRLFDLLGPINVEFQNLTLRSAGSTNNSDTGPNGGAVQALTANVVLRDCIVTDMVAEKGGAINAESGNVTLIHTTLSSNFARFNGGAVNATSGAVTLTRGSIVTDNRAINFGGGIAADSGTVQVLSSSQVDGNSTTFGGGGIFKVSGVVSVVDSEVNGNFAGQTGGGVSDVNGTVVARRSHFDDNTATFGGGVFVGTATLIDSTASGNFTSITGGGIDASAATLTRSTVSDNRTNGNGGGLTVGSATLVDSTVSRNTAATEGGGMLAIGQATLVRSTVDNNTAGTDGGGIKAFTVNLVNSTISTNHAHNGGGVFVRQGGAILNCTVAFNDAVFGGGVQAVAGPVNVKNTIIAKNTITTLIGRDVLGLFKSLGHNLIGNSFSANPNTDFSSAKGDQLNVDPRLGALADNGGLTRTHALLAGSLAIDHGDNAGAPATDQRGVARPRDGDGNGSLVVDIGAFEL